jgi:hypothetical protein
MNRDDFLNMLEDVIPVNRQMIGDVYELINIFPYFQTAHMLLLKGLQNKTDVKFESQLRNSAIHIADREVLYYLLTTKPSPDVDPGDLEQDNASSEKKLLLNEEPFPPEEKVFYEDPGLSTPDQTDLLELDLEVKKDLISGEGSIKQEKLDYKEKNTIKQSQSELIDKFIVTNPRIEPVKEITSLPVEDITKSFDEEEGGFVTETLARIYINQEYYSKAIDIYEKLSLKFPEKSSYFAAQIEKVKEYIKK